MNTVFSNLKEYHGIWSISYMGMNDKIDSCRNRYMSYDTDDHSNCLSDSISVQESRYLKNKNSKHK